jgi:alkaline phosphatase D
VTIFLHGVASGDPLLDRVVIWTRVTVPTGDAESVAVSWILARDEALATVVASGEATARAGADHTVSVDVGGLEPGTRYWYRFQALGDTSPTGRTRTLPPDGIDHLHFAMVSCAKFNSGYFNGYARIADRDDLDFVLHLGDYIYEASQTPPASQTRSPDIGRPFEPLHECRTLDDYRRRYAQYHADPDTQRFHHAHPMIGTLDDHEFADGAWRGGATEHREERDGPWATRKAAAFQAREEWLPIRRPDPADPTRVYRSVPLGGLADLLLIDTRSRRDEPVDGEHMADPGRTQLGPAQKAWLLDALHRSRAPWRLLANSSVMAPTWAPDLPEAAKPALIKLKLVTADGLGPDSDQWDGYPAERDEILATFAEPEVGDVVVLSGDVHVGLALELRRDPMDAITPPVAVEFVTSSLTSQNLGEKMGWTGRDEAVPHERALVEALPYVQWCDLDGHGYVVVDVTPERVIGEWWLVDTIRRRTDGERRASAWMVRRGDPRLVPATT